MPIYEYACDECGTRFERKQKFSEDPVRECPACGSEVRRVLHPAGIIFKGSGFYVTDNRGANSASASSNSSSSDGSSATKSESSAASSTSSDSSSSSSKAAS